jgi:hypothetical protein
MAILVEEESPEFNNETKTDKTLSLILRFYTRNKTSFTIVQQDESVDYYS